MFRSGYLIGLFGFVAVAGIYSFLIRPTSSQAIHFEEFKADRVAACASGGLEGRVCQCLIEKAASHDPLPKSQQIPRFNGDVDVSFKLLEGISETTLKDAFIRGTLMPATFKLSDYKNSNEAANERLKKFIKKMTLTGVRMSMEGCVPDRIYGTYQGYLDRGKKYYDVPDEMKRTFLVAEKRREMIAAGEIRIADNNHDQ